MTKRVFLVPNADGQMHLIMRESARVDFDRIAWSRSTPVLCSLCFGSLKPRPRIELRSGNETALLCCTCFDDLFQVVAD